MPRTILLSLLCLMLSGQSHALDRLKAGGVELGRAVGGVVERSVDLDGDHPVTTFVIARVGAGAMMQRTAAGVWTDWNGDPAALVDARVPLGVGTVTYRIDASPLGANALIIGYRTPEGLKYGVLALGGQP
ncbi:MAG: hypothetical protein ACOVVK_13135 [Elsteraceae bacterium]